MSGFKLHFIVDMDEHWSQFCPPMGVGYLSSYLKMNVPDIHVSLSFLSDNILADIEANQPDIIAISSTSRYFTRLRMLGEDIKKKFNIPIIWGGVHISIAPDELPLYSEVGVLGEGEETAIELLSHFNSGRFENLEIVRGIVFRKNGKLLFTQKRAAIDPLDKVTPPDLELFRVNWDRNHRAVMITSRGCPYKCRFCASSLFWDRTRLHSPEYTVKEMKELVEAYRVKEILIYDDFFTINKKRVEKIAELVHDDPKLKNILFECLSRVDNFNEHLATILKSMGVYRISFGIESGSQKTLDYLKNKTITLAQIEKAVATAKAFGFECIGSVIIGSPFETVEDIEESLSFVDNLKLDYVQITIATPFPGTQLWEDGKNIGKISDDVWDDAYYALFSSEQNISMFSSNTYSKIYDFLKDKKLVTQIDLAIFAELVTKAIKLQIKTNLRLKDVLMEKVTRLTPNYVKTSIKHLMKLFNTLSR